MGQRPEGGLRASSLFLFSESASWQLECCNCFLFIIVFLLFDGLPLFISPGRPILSIALLIFLSIHSLSYSALSLHVVLQANSFFDSFEVFFIEASWLPLYNFVIFISGILLNLSNHNSL